MNTSLNDKKLFLKSLSHNHPPNYDEKHNYCSSEVVTVVNSFNTHGSSRKRRCDRVDGILNEQIKFIIVEESDDCVS